MYNGYVRLGKVTEKIIYFFIWMKDKNWSSRIIQDEKRVYYISVVYIE